jgi:hypothetical protein
MRRVVGDNAQGDLGLAPVHTDLRPSTRTMTMKRLGFTAASGTAPITSVFVS